MGWLQLVGAGVSALAQHQQGQDAQAAADFNAAGVEQDSQLRAARIRKMADQTRSQARASLAASGVDVNSGTSTLIDSSIQSNSEQDVSNAIVSGYRQGNMMRLEGDAAARAGNYNAASTITSALGKYATENGGRWKRASNPVSGSGSSGSGVGATSGGGDPSLGGW